jgi:hypothetical protein
MLLLATAVTLVGSTDVYAHGTRPGWLDAADLEHGLHIAVEYPRVIRRPGPIDLKVTARNVSGPDTVFVETIDYGTQEGRIVASNTVDWSLARQKETIDAYEAALQDLHDTDATHTRAAEITCRNLLHALARAARTDRCRIPQTEIPVLAGSRLQLTVGIETIIQGKHRRLERPVTIAVESPLPRGTEASTQWRFDVPTRSLYAQAAAARTRAATGDPIWYAGDQHLHTTYSLDALALEGTTENVTDYAAAAESIGLDWIIITDHSNVHTTWNGTDYYTPQQFDMGTAEAAAYTANHALVALYGLEMGAGQTGFFALPSHYLAYPFSVDSTGYLANPSSGLLFGLANCEPEQVIIDRVNNAGGFGFIAHPFDEGTLAFAQWNFNNGATGWAGLEIWSDTQGQIKTTDDQAFAKWHHLLGGIAPPQQGVLAARPGFPNAFPVGLGNSDAHVIGLIGATFTYAWMTEVTRPAITEALMRGRCTASNGPLLTAQMNRARIGEVALLLPGDNELTVTLITTAEFGPVGDYVITVYVDGAVRTTIPLAPDPGFAATVELTGLNLAPPDTFVTVRADANDAVHHAITNPVWLQFVMPGDGDADGQVGEGDAAPFVDCLTGPQVERVAACDIMDFDRDRDVDLADFAGFQTAFTGG